MAAQLRQCAYGLDLVSQRRFVPSCPTCGVGTWTNSYYTYDAFGNLLSRTGTTPNHYLYAGEQFDPDLNLYFLRARYLDVRTGRFWSMDSHEGISREPLSHHKYLYAAADAINRVDPTGQVSVGEAVAVAGIATIIFNMATTVVAFQNIATVGGSIDGFLLSARVNENQSGITGGVGFDVVFDLRNSRISFAFTGEFGLNPVSIFFEAPRVGVQCDFRTGVRIDPGFVSVGSGCAGRLSFLHPASLARCALFW